MSKTKSNKNELDLSWLANFKQSSNIPDSHKKKAKKLMLELSKHFKKDKWDINIDLYVSEFVYEVLGYDPIMLLMSYMKNNKDVKLIYDYKKNKTLLRKK